MNGGGGDWLPPIPWDVLRARCFTPVQGRVLFALWSRCNAAGDCWPSVEALATDCGCDARAVRGVLETLTGHAVITMTRSGGRKPHRFHLAPAHILEFVRSHDNPIKSVTDKSARVKVATLTDSPVLEAVNPDTFVPSTLTDSPVLTLTLLSVEEEPIRRASEEEPVGTSPSFLTVTPETTARAVRPTKTKTVKPQRPVEDVTADLIAAHAGRWTPDEVRDRVEYALNHKASKAWADKEIGLKRWLKRDADSEDERTASRAGPSAAPYRNGTGGPAPPTATARGSPKPGPFAMFGSRDDYPEDRD